MKKFADDFASELLMPYKNLKEEVDNYCLDRYISFEDALKVSEYFGVSLCI